MALTNPPVAVSSFDSGLLAAGISASATTITISPIYKTVNGVRTKQGFDTTSGIALITHGDFTERVSFEGASVNATTKITTLTTCTRGLSATSTSASFTGGTGRAWSKGAKFTVVADVSYFQSSVYKTVPNTFTADQTITGNLNVSGRITQTGTDGALQPPQMTSTQRDALVSQRGIIENTTTGTFQQYIGAAWIDIGDAGTPNGSTTVAGKFEEATVAEQGTATATGETGARLVPAVANLVKTSSGAGDENKIPVLDSVGTLANGFLATSGTPDATTFLRGDRTWGTVSSGVYEKIVFLGAADSTALSNPTSFTDYDTYTYTVPANDLTATTGYEFFIGGTLTTGAAGTFGLRAKLGGVAFTGISSGSLGALSNLAFTFKGILLGTAAAGGSVAVRMSGELIVQNNASVILSIPVYDTQNIATNATAAIAFSAVFGTSNGSNTTRLKTGVIKKISTSLFS